MENSAIKVRKPETPSHYIRSEVRKVSTELEKACQEAFFRDSIGSSTTTRTSITDKPGPYDTPPSSIDNREFKQLPLDPSLIGRPLPAIPADTPNTYLSRLVEETRDKVAAYKSDGAENTAKFDELLGMLDKIVPSAKTPDKRAVSAPEPKTPDHLGFLPMISEEARSDDPRASRDGNGNWHRAVTSPVMRKGKAKEEKTVRIVEASSPGAVLPLNIRKHSDDSNNSYAASTGSRYLRDRQSQERLHAQRSNDRPGLDSIVEDALPAIPSEPVKKKKSGWFQRLKNQIDEETNKSGRTSIPSSWRELDDRNESKASPKTLTKAHRPVVSQPIEEPLSSDSSEFPMREDKGKRGFSKWFGRRSGDKKDGGRISGKSGHMLPLFVLSLFADYYLQLLPKPTTPQRPCSLRPRLQLHPSTPSQLDRSGRGSPAFCTFVQQRRFCASPFHAAELARNSSSFSASGNAMALETSSTLVRPIQSPLVSTSRTLSTSSQ